MISRHSALCLTTGGWTEEENSFHAVANLGVSTLSSVHCQEHKLGDGRDREVALWFPAATAETHMSHVTCHGLLRLIHDGDVGADVGDPLVRAAAVWRSVIWRVTHPALPPPGAAWVRLNAAFINTSAG